MSSQRSSPARFAYRALLLAYPRAFRRRFESGMTELFVARYERARKRGLSALVTFWLEIVGDTAGTAGRERLDSWRSRPTRRRKESKVDALIQDLKLAFRRIADAPGFACVALLILGLGIGVNVAMFGVVEGILFRPPPWDRPEELLWIYQDSDDGEPNACSYPAYRDIRAHDDLFSGVAAYIPSREARYRAPDGEARLVTVNYATSSLFPVLGLTPSRGRWFDEDADRPGGEPVGVLSHRAWQRRFGSDPDIVGRTVKLSGASVTILGVGPEGYGGEMPGIETDMWLSLSAAGVVGGEFYWSTLERREDHWFLVVARLKEGVRATEAGLAMDVLEDRLAIEYPDLNEGRDITVFPADRVRLHPEFDALLFPTGGVLLVLTGLVLLVACSNLANLLLARAQARGREIAVRLSMGATRGRLLRQLLTESTVLSLGGGLLGLLLAAWASRALVGLEPPLPIPMNLEFSLDARLLLFAFALSSLTGLLFGLVPALRASSPRLVPSLKDAAEGTSFGYRSRWFGLRNLLVSTQVATSFVLLVGAGLLIRSLVKAETAELGFVKDGLAINEIDVGVAGYEGGERSAFFRELRQRIEAVAGVQHVSLATRLPVTPTGGSSTLEPEGYEGKAEVIFALVDENYFETLRIPVLHGRVFVGADAAGSERVAIVNEAFVRRYWGVSDGVGRRYRHEGAPDSWTRIVGVVADAKVRTPHEAPTPIFYRPLTEDYGSRLHVVARTEREPAALAGVMRREIHALDPDIAIYRAGAIEEHVADALAVPRTAASTLGLLGGLALLLASMGLYAVVAFAVSRRRGEIGIRMALGANARNVVASVMKETMVVSGAGIVVGLVLALLATPVLSSVLYGVTASDPWTFASAAVFMMAIAAIAAYLPARRAAATDPVRALRVQ